MTITLNGTTGITTPDVTSDGLTVDSTTLVVDEANNRVGVGTGSPSYALHLVQPSSDNALVIDNGGGAGDNATPYLAFSGTNAGSNYIRGRIRAAFPDSTGGGLIFDTGSSGSMTERARIDSSGYLLVGTTSTTPGGASKSGKITLLHAGGSSTNGINLATTASSSRAIEFQYTGYGVTGFIATGTSTTSYNTSSDYRLKEDWQPMVGASERVKALNPVNFAWKVDGSRVDGFLAHEAQAVVPEAVSGEKDAVELVDIKDEDGNVTGQEERPVYQGIDQSKLVPLLTAALQEALAEIETLKARVSALEAA